jgi:hypothetical protein
MVAVTSTAQNHNSHNGSQFLEAPTQFEVIYVQKAYVDRRYKIRRI